MKMIKFVSIMLVAVLVVAIPTSAFGAANAPTSNQGERNSGQIMVKFRPGVTEVEKTMVHSAYGGKFKQTIAGIDVQIVTVLPEQASEKAKAYASNPNVIFAEIDGVAQADATVNDSYFGSQWGLAKVSAGEAWNTTTGSSDIRIAILDTGVDQKHPDLANKIVASINFSTSATDADVHGHGTHVAGIAAAITNNGTGVAGLGYNSSIMNVKVMGDDSYGYYSWISNGIIWAADHGANVINPSLGGGTSSSTLESAVNYAWNKGVVIVAAAGNAHGHFDGLYVDALRAVGQYERATDQAVRLRDCRARDRGAAQAYPLPPRTAQRHHASARAHGA